ncbi:MAG: hypothetical protein R6U61_02105 [Thermoplasmata archaeon]
MTRRSKFLKNPGASKDTDGDGVGDNADTDDDGILDSEDEHPWDPLNPEKKSDPFPWWILSVILLVGGLLLTVYMAKEKNKRYQEDENTQTPSTEDKELSQQE